MADEYPKIQPSERGFVVYTGPKATLPGVYMNHRYAENAMRRHLALKGKARKNGGAKK